jgi:DNA polymerase
MTEFKSRAYIDLETYNETSISVGLYKYAETVEITLFAYALDDEPVEVWDVTTGKPMPACLRAALLNPEVQLVAHNAAFERICIRHALKMDIPIERWFCTMAQSFAHSMPGSLGGLGEAQGLKEDERKHKIGNSLVLHFCKPKPKNQTLRRATRITHPVEWAQFIDYCAQDVAQMRTSHKKLPMWKPPTEKRPCSKSAATPSPMVR